MKLSDRFSYYGLIGGLFWLLHITAAIACGVGNLQDALDFLHGLTTANLTLIGALGLIVVFTTGLCIDIFGASVFRGIEIYLFARLAKEYEDWFQHIAPKYGPSVYNDLELLLPLSNRSFQARLLDRLTLRSYKTSAIHDQPTVGTANRRRAYHRLSTFLLSFVSLQADTDRAEILTSQTYLWDISRNVAMCLTISSFIWFFTTVVAMLFDNRLHLPLVRLCVGYTISLFLPYASIFMAAGAYERYCISLFSMATIITAKEDTRSANAGTEANS